MLPVLSGFFGETEPIGDITVWRDVLQNLAPVVVEARKSLDLYLQAGELG